MSEADNCPDVECEGTEDFETIDDFPEDTKTKCPGCSRMVEGEYLHPKTGGRVWFCFECGYAKATIDNVTLKLSSDSIL